MHDSLFVSGTNWLCIWVQSPWFIDGQRKGVSSVEERIADVVLPAFKADKHKFMTAGTASLEAPHLVAEHLTGHC